MLVNRTFYRLAVFTICLLTCGAPSATAAEAERSAGEEVAIGGLHFQGNLPGAAQTLLLEQLAEGLKQGKIKLRAGAESSTTPCQDTMCYRALAARLVVDYLVVGRVTEEQKTYDIELELVAGSTGRGLGKHRQRCQICGLSEAGERMSLAATALTEKLQQLLREPAHLTVKARPHNAVVVVNGEPKGQVPQEVDLPAGRHKLQVISPGYRTIERQIEVVPSVDQALELDMMAIPSDFPYRTAGWASVTAGVALLAAGVVTMTMFNGNEVSCRQTERDAQGDCPKIFSSAWLANALFATGAATATLGGVWLYLGRHETPAAAMGNPAAVSLHAGWRGHF